MAELQWFGLNLPREMALEDVVAVVRPLAHRPKFGLVGAAVVVIEAWSEGGRISWRLGLDRRIAHSTPAQMAAHLLRLTIQPLGIVNRPALTLAADLTVDGIASPLRTELAGSVSAGLVAALQRVGTREVGVVQWILGPSRQRQQAPEPFDLPHALGFRERRKPDPGSQRLWAEKTSEGLFACRGRVGAFAAKPERAFVILSALGDALKLANNNRTGLRVGKANRAHAAELVAASTRITWSALLNAIELAALLGWPIESTDGEDLGLVGGHINEAPRALLLPQDEASSHPDKRVLGESLHAGQFGQLVTVPVKTSVHHLVATGPTGSGKSTLLCGLITADIAAGRSVLVVEPRGDLINDVLARVPVARRDRVVVIDPAQKDRVVGLNVLAGDPDEAERRADDIVHLLSELHGGNLGPRSTDIALHALLTASRLPDGTICDLPILLTNPAFRRQVLAQVSDPLVLGPWWAGFDALSDAERGQHIAPLLNKLRPLTSRDSLRRMLSQAAPHFQLDELFTTPGTIVLINLNRGLLGTPTANLLGALVLSQVWSSIQRRAAIPASKRHAVMAVVDEFQDYLRLPGGMDFGDALAQSRGLSVGWTLAHQHLDQLSAAQQAGAFANARSRVAFRPAPGDARPLATALGGGLTGDDLLRLKAYEACCQLYVDGQPSRPFSVRTRPLPPWTSNPDRLRHASAQRYGIDAADLDQALTKRWQVTAASSAGPVGLKRKGNP